MAIPKEKSLDKVKAGKESAKTRKLQKKIRELIKSGDISNLQAEALENWAEMLNDPDKQVRAFATKEVSKFIFAPKKEHNKYPDININVKFVNIKNGK